MKKLRGSGHFCLRYECNYHCSGASFSLSEKKGGGKSFCKIALIFRDAPLVFFHHWIENKTGLGRCLRTSKLRWTTADFSILKKRPNVVLRVLEGCCILLHSGILYSLLPAMVDMALSGGISLSCLWSASNLHIFLSFWREREEGSMRQKCR